MFDINVQNITGSSFLSSVTNTSCSNGACNPITNINFPEIDGFRCNLPHPTPLPLPFNSAADLVNNDSLPFSIAFQNLQFSRRMQCDQRELNPPTISNIHLIDGMATAIITKRASPMLPSLPVLRTMAASPSGKQHLSPTISASSDCNNSARMQMPCLSNVMMSTAEIDTDEDIDKAAVCKKLDELLDDKQCLDPFSGATVSLIPIGNGSKTGNLLPTLFPLTPEQKMMKTVVERPFVCPHFTCKKKFKHESNLRIHMRVHSDDAFVCKTCGKKFARRSNMKQHERVHSGECPFKCHLCLQSFKQKHSLKDHIKIHSLVNYFGCFYCTMFFF